MIYLSIYVLVVFILELVVFNDYIKGKENLDEDYIMWYQRRILTWPFVLICLILFVNMMFIEEFLMARGWIEPSNTK